MKFTVDNIVEVLENIENNSKQFVTNIKIFFRIERDIIQHPIRMEIISRSGKLQEEFPTPGNMLITGNGRSSSQH